MDNKAPDGGYGWVILLCSTYLFMSHSATYASYGIFLTELLDTFRCTKAEVAVIGALCGGASGASGIFLGPLVERFGYRKVALTSSFLLSSGIIISAFAPNLLMLYLTYGLMPGINWGSVQVSTTVALVQYFENRRGLAIGIRAFGLSAGVFIWPHIIRLLIDCYGWRGAMLLFGGINLNTLVASALLIPRTTRTVEPENKPPCSLENIVNFKVMKYLKVDLFFIVNLLMLAGHSIVFIFTPVRVQRLGMSKEVGAVLVSAVGITSSISRPITGIIADKIKKYRIVVHGVCIFMTGVVNVISSQLTSFIGILLCCIGFGLLSGCYVVLQYVVLVDITPKAHFPVAASLLIATAGLSDIILNPLAGWFIDVTGNFGVPFLIYGIAQTISGITCWVIFVLHRMQKREKPAVQQVVDGEGTKPLQQDGNCESKYRTSQDGKLNLKNAVLQNGDIHQNGRLLQNGDVPEKSMLLPNESTRENILNGR